MLVRYVSIKPWRELWEFSFSMPGRNKFGSRPLLPRLRVSPHRRGYDLVPYMVAGLLRCHKWETSPWGAHKTPGTCFLGRDWGPLGGCLWERHWQLQGSCLLDAGKTCWGLSIVEMRWPLHAGGYLPQKREERNHKEAERQDFLLWRPLVPSAGKVSQHHVTSASRGERFTGSSFIQHHRAGQYMRVRIWEAIRG